jgi:flavin reductase (DIM6/NTAB) family NADH-FMN oxidoreductase RutF
MGELHEIAVESIRDNVFKLIGADWMLITAGNDKQCNPMTASWGGLGVLWNRNVCFCFIRPTRHTYGFMEKGDTFTLSFFDGKYRNVLNFCGSNSGRTVDKIAAAKLTPVRGTTGGIYFAEARLVLECRKIYYQDITPASFIDPAIGGNYPEKDYHRMYVGEIVRCLAE